MRLHDLIHAPTRPAWTARLVVYVALIVSVIICVQVGHVFFGIP